MVSAGGDETTPEAGTFEEALAVWSDKDARDREYEVLSTLYTSVWQAELAASGVEFPADTYDWADSPPDEAVAIERAHIIGTRARNAIMLLDLVATKVEDEIYGAEITDTQKDDAKRRIQVNLFSGGYGPPWFELLNRELPGTGYDDAQLGELIAAVKAESERYEEKNQNIQIILSSVVEMLGLTDDDVASSDFTTITFGAICRLAHLKLEYDKAKQSGDVQKAGSIIENERRRLIDSGLFHGTWVTTFETLFS